MNAALLIALLADGAGSGGNYGLLESLPNGGAFVLDGLPLRYGATNTLSISRSGIIGSTATSDTTPSQFVLAPPALYPAATVNYYASTNMAICGVVPPMRIVMTAAGFGGDHIDFVVDGYDSSPYTVTENGTNDATHIDCTGETNATCSSNLSSWINTYVIGYRATANSPTSGTVYISRDEKEVGQDGFGTTSGCVLDITPSDTTNAAVLGESGAIPGQIMLYAMPVINPQDEVGVIAERPAFNGAFSTHKLQLSSGGTVAAQREYKFMAPQLDGVSGGGTETYSDAATGYTNAQPSGSNITITRAMAHWFDAGLVRVDGTLSVGTDNPTVTVDGATTFAITGSNNSSYVILQCTGAETINTITGAQVAGTLLIIDNSDTDCTIADDEAAVAANAIDLTGAGTNDVGAVDKVIALIYTGNYWMELFESDN